MSQNSPDTILDKLEIDVSRDHFTAYLRVKQGAEPGLEDIKKRLKNERITYGIKDYEKVSIFLDNMDLYDNTLIIASGKPFTNGNSAKIEFRFEADSRSEIDEHLGGESSIDFRRVGTISSVRKGDVVAVKTPAEQGEEGITIYGQTLPGEWGMDVILSAGPNVSLSKNGMEYISEIDGAPIVSNGMIRVDPIYIIEGDVDYSTGNITFDGTIAVKGSILDGFEVNARGDIIVENTIQSARVVAGGDIVVKRGILTRGKGLVSAEGNIFAKFIENSVVESENNIVVENAIMNSRVYCNGRIIAMTEEGSIIGGQLIAHDRIICKNLGSPAHPTTVVQVGFKYDVQKKYIEASTKFRQVQKQIRQIQKNYEYVSKTDSNDLDKLGELRGKMIKLIKVQDQMKEDLAEIAARRVFNQFSMIEIEQALYQGVHVLIGDSRYQVQKEAKYASFKWDSEDKSMYLTSFDETGQGLRKGSSSKARTVLIIDDSKSVRKTLGMILERMGLSVVDEAEDGEIGVEKYKQHKPTIVTCDIAMVNMNGIETLKEIRKLNPNAKVVMISSNRDKNKVLDCVMNGAKDYVLKPFVPARVTTIIKTVLDD
ncbi:MAG TPA: FapA family protein [bacterium]|nr:FapA family protein [bacterium]